MNTSSTIASTTNRLDVRQYLRLALVGAALIGASACDAASTGSADTTTRVSVPAATIEPSTSTTGVAPTDPTSTTVATAPTPTPSTEARPTAMRDELAEVAGQRIHIRCIGTGPTTVLLISGFEAGSDGWATIEPALAGQARVCSYDRPGTGTSDPPNSTVTFASQATELHTLLAVVGESGPYVVVGQSFGGAEAATFASRFTGEVVGLVLVDASPVTWPADLCAVADDGSAGAVTVRMVCAGFSDPSSNHERLDVVGAFAEASMIVSLGSLPMTVLTAVDRELPPLVASEVARLTERWNDGQQHWTGLSTDSRLVSVEHTGHHIEIDEPTVVVDAIAQLLP